MRIHESGEDYLETILLLYRKQGYVRSTDVANAMNYTKASISRAVKILKEEDYIYMDPNKMIFLTEKGEKKALEIHERHEVIREFLMVVLNVDEETADHDACHIEHVVSPVTFDGIKKLLRDTKEAKTE
ncbi:MAG: metal-dependent transcriptional regulator [Peptococcaceae bacterium]|nr:metal-dependent transcriptional regulator [Peptococcaceae bacterium]MBQ2120089.1 metal-dependent transcriptional regulator [Peptococcaceae bacterium]MBQ5681991.1 metal-dependent transcriptional regulator [Peptococcaceae bacterium]MBQ5703008.1 metal-dependent transcriptional regulator [Peptococcaceae bacterium]